MLWKDCHNNPGVEMVIHRLSLSQPFHRHFSMNSLWIPYIQGCTPAPGHPLNSCGIIFFFSPPPAGHRCPPARSGHRCVADNSNLYVFGGYNPDYDESGGPENEDYPLFRELWRYNFATDTWHQMGTEGYMPRELASMSRMYGNAAPRVPAPPAILVLGYFNPGKNWKSASCFSH